MTKVRPVLYPCLCALYPVLFFYARNAREVPLDELILPMSLVVAVALSLWGALVLVLRDVHRAGVVAALGVVLFATIQSAPRLVRDFLEYLSSYWVLRDCPVRPGWVIAIQLGLFAALALYAVRRLKNPRSWTPVLNVFALALLAFPLSVILPVRSRAMAYPEVAPQRLASLPPAPKRPDVYYLILDGFARSDVLQDLYSYDLEPFLAGLERRGFYVARQSTSNYCQTSLSLASSLNGRYLDTPANPADEELSPAPILFRKNAVISSLRPLGYRFVTFSVGLDFTDYARADIYLSPYRHISGFHRMLLEYTPIVNWLPNPAERDSYALTRDRTNFVFDRLPEVARIPGPKFTFAHVLAPHPPFVFGPDGEDVSPHQVPYWLSDGSGFRQYYGGASYVPGYRKQVEFLTKRVERAIDGILANSPEPPIIILQSDHGSGLRLSLTSAEHTDHWERMSILNAYYFPGGMRAGLHDRITPVNSFRVLLNLYFGARLALLPEENYYSSWDRPMRFQRVTDKVRRRAPGDSASRGGVAKK